jgi:CrcB protein
VTALLVALGAALGSALRYAVASRLDVPKGLPWGTLVVNVTGSALLGAVSAAALSGHTVALLGTGFCGGFTTYSAFAVQTHGLGARRGTAYAVLTVAASLGACALGFWVYA